MCVCVLIGNFKLRDVLIKNKIQVLTYICIVYV